MTVNRKLIKIIILDCIVLTNFISNHGIIIMFKYGISRQMNIKDCRRYNILFNWAHMCTLKILILIKC